MRAQGGGRMVHARVFARSVGLGMLGNCQERFNCMVPTTRPGVLKKEKESRRIIATREPVRCGCLGVRQLIALSN